MENNESSVLLPTKSAGHRRSKTIEKRNIHTSKGNYDKSTRFGSLQEPSIELPKFKVKNLLIDDGKLS